MACDSQLSSSRNDAIHALKAVSCCALSSQLFIGLQVPSACVGVVLLLSCQHKSFHSPSPPKTLPREQPCHTSGRQLTTTTCGRLWCLHDALGVVTVSATLITEIQYNLWSRIHVYQTGDGRQTMNQLSHLLSAQSTTSDSHT